MLFGEIAILTVGGVLDVLGVPGVLDVLDVLDVLGVPGVLDVLDVLDVLGVPGVLMPSAPPQLLSTAIAREAAERLLRCRISLPRCRRMARARESAALVTVSRAVYELGL
jgi:hypothetical protein